MSGAGGKRDDIAEVKAAGIFAMEVPPSDTMSGAGGKRDDIAEVKAAGILAMGVLTGVQLGPPLHHSLH